MELNITKLKQTELTFAFNVNLKIDVKRTL